MLSRPRKHTGEILHQYCTAIPIGTAVAQSWNTGLAEALGDIVSWLLQEGYKIVPVSQLLLQGETAVDHTGRQLPA